MKQEFEVPILKAYWTYVDIPFDTETVFGVKLNAKVCGTINGVPYENTLMPKGDGYQFLIVGNKICKAAGVKKGDWVTVTMELNPTPPQYEMPDYFQEALNAVPEAKIVFEKYSRANQRQIIKTILQPKSEVARWNRIEKLLK